MTIKTKVFAEGLNFPTSVTFGDAGTIYVAESGLPFGGAPPGGKVWRLDPNGKRECLLSGLRTPVNGLLFLDGALIVSEGGYPGRISRLDLVTGASSTILDGLPGFGNYHTNMVAAGPDGKLYFSQGAMTNSGVIGLDSHDLGWLRHVPHNCDVPGYDITVADFAATTSDPRTGAEGTTKTGAFAPFGHKLPKGTLLTGRTPCTAAVMRCNADGSELELVAWGLRNAFGLGFLPDGRLLAIDQGADARGSRPLAHCPDALYEVKSGAWYGWPDFICGRPAISPEFAPVDSVPVRFVLDSHESLPIPEHPLYEFEVNSAAVKFCVVPVRTRTPEVARPGNLLVALFGDEKPLTAPEGPRVGRALLRLNPSDWNTEARVLEGLKRPIDVRFAPDGSFYVLDFGHFEITPRKGVSATAGSGRLLQVETSH